jgi:hypothetical protein
MRKGRQNQAIGADPTVFPKTLHILDQMYTGGYTCVINASKYFYNFPTLPEERCYLGVISSRTSKAFVYAGLAKGAGNSPSIVGRKGASFLCKLEEVSPRFQGRPMLNTWWQAFAKRQQFDPKLSHGMVKISAQDGLPAVLSFAHCDDFMIHGPTYDKTRLASIDFLDLTVKVGLLAHPMKLTPPCQEVKYTGFIWNTEGIPTLKVPSYKVDKSIALIDYALDHRAHVSRLCLSVVKGVLESEVDATPARSGHTHLRSLEHTIHPRGWEGLPYYLYAQLSPEDVLNLQWWKRILEVNHGQTSRVDNASLLVPSFGDGSGTGTGGTVQYNMDEPMQMWKAVWTCEARANTSNWKEAETCRLTLERAKAEGRKEVRGCTFFYFTDNTTSYFAITKGASRIHSLHVIVTAIKELEAELGCRLEPIHVPGTTIIIQTTDGLSRGIWGSALQNRLNQEMILSEIFSPIPMCPTICEWACSVAHIPPTIPYHFRRWDVRWSFAATFNRLTVWAPPPEVAGQLFHFLLHVYVEAPLTTAAIVIVPRVLQRRWMSMSRVVTIVEEYQRTMIPVVCHTNLTIPVVVMLIPFHIRTLSVPIRLDLPTATPARRMHEAAKTRMYGMLEDLDSR